MKTEEQKKKLAEYMRGWNRRNPEKVKASAKKKYWNNKEVDNARSRAWRAKNKEVKAIKDKDYRETNKEKVALNKKRYYFKNRAHLIKVNGQRSIHKRKTNAIYRLRSNLQRRILHILMDRGLKKTQKTEDLLGAKLQVVKTHLEERFKTGMNWNNHGMGEGKWHIDHRIPLASAKTEEETIKLFHYTNLQPLWQKENLMKGSKLIYA